MADLTLEDRLFAGTTQKTAIGTTELNAVLFRNPSGGTRTVVLKQIHITNSHTVASYVRVRVYVNPTVTATGAAVTRVALDVGSGNTATAEMFNTPTTTANGSQIFDWIVQGGATASTHTFGFPDGFQLRANNSLLITATAESSSRVLNTSIVWEE